MATKFGEGYYEIYPKINQAAIRATREALTKGLGDEFAKTQAGMRKEDTKTTNERVRNNENVTRSYKKQNESIRQETKKTESGFHKLATQFRTIGTVLRGFSLATAVLGGFNTLRIALGGIAAALPIINAGLIATPSLLASVGAEAIVLKIAFRGVGTAISDAFNPKKAKQYQQELKRLAPAARQFVKEIAALKDLKLPNLQQTLFSQKGIQQTGKNLPGLVKGLAPGANRVAGASGGLLGAIGSSVTGAKGLAAFQQVLRSLALTLRAVTPGLKKFVDGMLELIGHVSALGTGSLGKKFGDWLGKVGNFLSKIDVAKAFAKGKSALHGLLSVGSDVLDIFKKIFKALNTGQALGAFSGLLHGIRQFVDSGVGQKFLKQLSGTLSTLSTLASSVTGSALKLLAGAFAVLYPEIKPVAEIIAKIAKDLVPLGPAIGQMAKGALKAFGAALKIIEPLIKSFVDMLASMPPPLLQAIGAALLIIVGAIKAFKIIQTVVKWYKEWAKVQATLNLVMDTNVFLLIVAAIAILVVAIIYIATKTHWFQNIWKAVWGTIKAVASAVWKFLTHGLGQLVLLLLGPVGALIFLYKHWKQIWAGILAVLKATWNVIYGIFRGIKNFFIKTVPSWFSTFRDWVAYFLKKTADIAKNFINNDIIKNFNKFKNFFTKTVPGWLNTFKNLAIDAIKKTATGIWTAWTKVANFLWTPINFVVTTVYDKGIRGFWNATVGKIPGIGKALSLPYVTMPKKFAYGGHVRGPGSNTSDSIRANLSDGEYVINAGKVKKYGKKFFDSLNFGPQYSGDGSGSRGFNVFDVGYKGGGAVATIPDRVSATLGWLRSIAGHIPYQLGGNGPNSFDCSSLVGNVWARLTNNPINKRYFVTGTEGPWLASHGFSKGADPTGFTVGFNGDHTTGILAGHRFEAAHTGTKMRFDDGATSALSFPNKYHMTGITGLGGGIGYDPIIDKVLKGGLAGILGGGPGTYLAKVWDMIKHIPHPGVDKGAVDLPKKAITGLTDKVAHGLFSAADAAKKLALKALSNLGKSFKNLFNNQSLTSTVGTMLQAAGAPQTWLGDILKIIRGESGGNANAINNYDRNAASGNNSVGLMQLTRSNFDAYRSKKLPNDPFNPGANIYAGIKYIQARYHDINNVPWINGSGRYYSKGGLVPTLFDSGGYLPPKSMTLAANNTSNWEKVGGGGFPSKVVLDLGNDRTIELMMDSRIAKDQNDFIRYSATH